MAQDFIEYASILSALEVRRKLWNSRVNNIDVAIANIKKLIDMEPSGTSSGSMAKRAEPDRRQAISQQKRYPAVPPASAGQVLGPERRKTPGLNIYVNRYPEWSREMARGNLHFRKKAGLRCPKCGSSDTRKSVTEGIGRLFAMIFGYTNARCRNCKSRFRFKNEPQTSRYGRVEVISAE